MPAALKSIDAELGNLWAPRSKRRLTLLTDRIREIARDVKQLQGQAAAYAAYQRQKDELENGVAAERAGAEAIRRRLRRLEQLEQAREPWAILLSARQKAAELGAVKDFPPHGLEHLENLKGDREKLRRDLLDREGEAARLEERLQQIMVDEGLLAQRETLEVLFGERVRALGLIPPTPTIITGSEN